MGREEERGRQEKKEEIKKGKGVGKEGVQVGWEMGTRKRKKKVWVGGLAHSITYWFS